MSHVRKTVLTSAISLVAFAIFVALWSQPSLPSYQGRSVKQWFSDCAKGQLIKDYFRSGRVDPMAMEAFGAMGTNAVPFLAVRITSGLRPSRFELWRMKLPAVFQPTQEFKCAEAYTAAVLLRACVKPPDQMLRPLLLPAMKGTNYDRSYAAFIAIGKSLRRGHADPDWLNATVGD